MMPTQTRQELTDEARAEGYRLGWDSASYADAYGRDPYASSDVPDRFATVAGDYVHAWEQAVTNFDLWYYHDR